MKSLMWLIKSIVLLICLSNDKTKAKLNVCNNVIPGAFVMHPKNCRLFYLCMQDDAISAFCPPGMLFNPEIQLCDVAENVNCLTETEVSKNLINNSGNNVELKEANKICQSFLPIMQQHRIVYIGSGRNCSIYYMCYYGQALRQECSMDLHWNKNTNKCDLPANAQCTFASKNGQYGWMSVELDLNNVQIHNQTNAEIVTSTISNINYNGLILCPTYGEHIFPHMERCDFFIYCVKGHATLQRCPFFRHFDVRSNRCQLQSNAICVRDMQLT